MKIWNGNYLAVDVFGYEETIKLVEQELLRANWSDFRRETKEGNIKYGRGCGLICAQCLLLLLIGILSI